MLLLYLILRFVPASTSCQLPLMGIRDPSQDKRPHYEEWGATAFYGVSGFRVSGLRAFVYYACTL